MSAVEVYQSPALERQDVAIQRLTDWAQSAHAAMAVAEQLSRSSFVPEAFRNKPGEATAAILAGLEVGLQPMAALRAFDVIQGQAAPRAITLRAVVQSQGHEIELVESTASRCKMRGRRQGSTAWQEVVWTIDRANQLKLTNKPNWQNQPQAMLVARATSELARLVASDAILGIAYSTEELVDGAGAGVEVPTLTAAAAPPAEAIRETSTPGTRRMSRRRPAEPTSANESDVVDGEVVEPAPDPEPEPERSPDAVTDAQVKKMIVSFKEQGITAKDDRIAYINATIGRTVESSKDLTKAEASQVIDMLEGGREDVPPLPDEEPF